MLRKTLVSLALAGIALPALSGCLWRLHRAHHNVHKAVRAAVTHRWVYYPHSGVYHCTKTGWYWHRHNSRWIRVKRLPGHYRLRRHVVIKHTAKEPWRKHDHHAREYK